MNDPISQLIINLNNLGFFRFIIPFILTSAIFYGLLRRSRIFGDPKENVAVNATIAISAAFLVSAAPIIAGIDIANYLSGFLIYSLFVIIGIIIIVFLPIIYKPALEEFGKKELNKKTFLVIFFLTLCIFITIGMLIFGSHSSSSSIEINEDFYTLISLLIFIIIFSFFVYITLKPTKHS